jgi:tRNA threonylcarbamoyladenosine biosynthesis protein TsaB
MLHVLIDQVMKKVGLRFDQLDAIAVSQGPGSYTGLRIGVSAAKGLCYATDKPLIAIDTTAIIAHHAFQIAPEAKHCIAMIDARRMEVYCGIFDRQHRLSQDSAIIVDEEFVNKHQDPKIIFAGDGAEKILNIAASDQRVFNFLPSAEMMTTLATTKFRSKEFAQSALFEPYYLKDYMPGITKKNLL